MGRWEKKKNGERKRGKEGEGKMDIYINMFKEGKELNEHSNFFHINTGWLLA